MSKISLQMYTMREHTKTLEDLDNCLGRLSEIGFDMVQYSIPPHYNSKEVKKIFDKHNMANDSIFCSWLCIEDTMNKIISDCELFNTKYVRCESITNGLTTHANGYKCYAHYLNEACSKFKKHGIKLLYHFHAFEFKRFGDLTGIEIMLKETDP